MKRSPLKRHPKRVRKLDATKVSTRSRVSKGPARDAEHLARIREHGCLLTGRVLFDHCGGPDQAHHVRCVGPRSMGKRVSDYLTLPLCRQHHEVLHSMNEAAFWAQRAINPRFWIAQLSPEGAAEIARLNGAEAKSSDVAAVQGRQEP